jgi:hypothetical protein
VKTESKVRKGAKKMADRYIRSALTIIALALWVLAFQSISKGLVQTHAQTKPPRHCVWTHINDQGEPNIGEDGNIDFTKGPNWKRVSEEGWELKAVEEHNYVFEKCEP